MYVYIKYSLHTLPFISYVYFYTWFWRVKILLISNIFFQSILSCKCSVILACYCFHVWIYKDVTYSTFVSASWFCIDLVGCALMVMHLSFQEFFSLFVELTKMFYILVYQNYFPLASITFHMEIWFLAITDKAILMAIIILNWHFKQGM